MMLNEVYVLRVLELRCKTEPVTGTLCRVEDPKLIQNAMSYLDIWNDGFYISHPYIELPEEVWDNVTEEVFKIFIDMVHLYLTPFTSDEIRSIIDVSKKYGYSVTKNKNHISIRRSVNNEEDTVGT
jgi:hypothetical protein